MTLRTSVKMHRPVDRYAIVGNGNDRETGMKSLVQIANTLRDPETLG